MREPCVVCGAWVHFTDEEEVPEWVLCPDHQKLHLNGFVALVEIDPEKSRPEAHGDYLVGTVWRTGNLSFIHRSLLELAWPDWDQGPAPMVCVTRGVIGKMARIEFSVSNARIN